MIPALVITAALLGTDVPETGTILYLEHSNLVVERVTGSPLSHVAMVVQISGQPWIYEATPAEVRRVALANYLGEIAQLNRSRSTQIRVLLDAPSANVLFKSSTVFAGLPGRSARATFIPSPGICVVGVAMGSNAPNCWATH